jgi:hypothetical protein
MIDRAILRTLCLLLVIIMVGPMLSGQVSSASDSEKVTNATATYNLYFGDLHTHTGYSDAYGDSTPWDAYQAAIDAGADFMAVTDHVSIWHAYQGLTMDPEEWADTLDAADYYTSDEFVAMAGYEAWLLAQCGEINVYNTRELPPAQPMKYRFDRLANFYDWLAQQSGAIGQWNHPLYMSRDFMDYNFYTESRDTSMSMIEVYNDVYYGDSYVKALDAGWHIMPTANSDTHYPDWIAGHEMRSVLLAESLTPANLYAAMSACRGYATLDKNLEIYYTLDGAVMGSTLSSADGTYTASIQISDPDGLKDEITLVEIVSDGGEVVASIPTSGDSVDLTIELVSEDARYFFVRVTTASPLEGDPGVTAWTAPVWTS